MELGLDFYFSVWVSVLQSTFMQLLSACVREKEKETVDAIFDLVWDWFGLGSGEF